MLKVFKIIIKVGKTLLILPALIQGIIAIWKKPSP